MPIDIPVSQTKIASSSWGIPITDEVNRLTAVSTPTAWTKPTYLNGWSDYTSTRVLRYRKRGDLIDIYGLCKGGTNGSVIFRLPYTFTVDLGYVINSTGAFASVAIDVGGNVTYVGGVTTYVYLSISAPLSITI